MKSLTVLIDVDAEGNCALEVTYPPYNYTCIQALQPKDTISKIQKQQAKMLKRCTEVNDVLPELCDVAESKYVNLSTRLKVTLPLLKRMQADLFAVQKSLMALKKKLS
jgi:hypothetical protein